MKSPLALVALALACGGRQPAPPSAAAPRPVPVAPEPAGEPALVVVDAPAPVEEPPAAEPPAAVASGGYVPTSHDLVFLGQVIAFIDELAAMVDATQGSCDRMADGLEILMRRNQALIAHGNAIEKQPERQAWFKQEAEPRMMASLQRMMGPLSKCASNERVKAAFDRFGS